MQQHKNKVSASLLQRIILYIAGAFLLGSVKIVYDCSCVVISLLLGIIGLHRIVGFGVATIISAVCVGRILSLLQNTIGKRFYCSASS